jgi:hypothetical protein
MGDIMGILTNLVKEVAGAQKEALSAQKEMLGMVFGKNKTENQAGAAVKQEGYENKSGMDKSSMPTIFGVAVCGNLSQDLANNDMETDDILQCTEKIESFFDYKLDYLSYENLQNKDISPKVLKHFSVIVASALQHFGISEPNVVYTGKLPKDVEENCLDEGDVVDCLSQLTWCSDGSWPEHFVAKHAKHLSILLALILKYRAVGREAPAREAETASPSPAAQNVFCGNCGHQMPAGIKFCGSCGKSL